MSKIEAIDELFEKLEAINTKSVDTGDLEPDDIEELLTVSYAIKERLTSEIEAKNKTIGKLYADIELVGKLHQELVVKHDDLEGLLTERKSELEAERKQKEEAIGLLEKSTGQLHQLKDFIVSPLEIDAVCKAVKRNDNFLKTHTVSKGEK